MNFKAYSIILTRQIKQKFGRFLLASGGIAVGVWAITLTNGLSAGVQSTVVTAINSQPAAKEVQVYSTKDESVVLGSQSPVFIPTPVSEWMKLKEKYSAVDTVTTNQTMAVNMFTPGSDYSCAIQQVVESNPIIRKSQQQVILMQGKTDKNCKNITINKSNLNNLYEEQRTNWVGADPTSIGSDGVVLCYSCSVSLHSLWGAEKPEDMIGKQVIIEPTKAPIMYALGQSIKFERDSVENFITSEPVLSTPYTQTYTIQAVINDAKTSAISLGGGAAVAYIPEGVFDASFSNANPGIVQDDYGVIGVTVKSTTYDQVEQLSKDLSKKHLAIAPYLVIIQGIQAIFQGLNVVLFIFGLIAIIASIFGIVNVMAVSVLERKKEIGILKALGAKDGSIFGLFLTESALLGVLGWVIGTLAAVGIGYGISAVFNWFASNNEDFKNSLAGFNITHYAPYFSPWLLVFTLVLALFFTIMAGILPSLKAARQNPAEVMRAE